jgi:Na+/proline symporter
MTDAQPKTESPARYVVRMPNSQMGVASYGVVEFLRAHPLARAIVAILGVALIVASILSLGGLKVVAWLSGFGIFTLIIVSPALLWYATVSGPRFELAFANTSPSPDEALKERLEAEKKFEKSNAPEDALKVDLTRLQEYYAMNQGQGRSSFRWAKFSMVAGFITIIGGIWLFYFRNIQQPDKFMAALSTGAGCVVSLVSGLFLHLYSKTQDRSLIYSEKLARMQKLYVAIRLVEAHTDPEKQTDARNFVIKELLATAQGDHT